MKLQIATTSLDNLYLDPRNPRLGRRLSDDEPKQSDIASDMLDWSLEELATSFLESGFWPQEAVLCVEESLAGVSRLVVVEGNRRIATLRFLQESFDGSPPNKKWEKLILGYSKPDGLFSDVPYILMDSRESIDDFLGFRHVTGIKEWDPAEKAEYIAYLIDKRGYDYEVVRKKIGSKTDAVRRNYIAYRLLQQMKESSDIDESFVLKKFSVMFLSLRTAGVREFLGINGSANPDEAKSPVPDDKRDALVEYALWLFGDEDHSPIVSDSRQVDRFSRVLLSENAVHYLRQATKPKLDNAYVIAGGEEAEIVDLIEVAAINIEQSLSTAHLYYADSAALKAAIRRVTMGAQRLGTIAQEAVSTKADALSQATVKTEPSAG